MSRILLALLFLSGALWGQVPAGAKNDTSAPTTALNKPTTESVTPLEAARTLLKDHRYGDAATAFRAIVDKYPAAEEAQVGLMRSLVRTGHIDDAEAVGKKALAPLSNSAVIHAAFGDVEFRAGKLGEAEKEYRKALKLDSNSARAWFGMGRMYDVVYLRRRAQSAFAKAHELDPGDEQIFESWLDTLSYAKALEVLKKHAGEHPTKRESAMIKFLAEASQKKPYTLAHAVKHSEIKLRPYGRELVDAGNSANRIGAVPVSKGFGIQLKFNDHVKSVLLFDTGADGITIGRKLAEKAGVVKIADAYFGGIGDKGPVAGYLGWIDKINIGNLEFHNCIVEVSSRNDVADEAGLVGADIFRHYLITLDWKEWKMILSPLPKNPAFAGSEDDPQDRYIAPEMQSFAKAYRFGDDHLFIPVVVSDKVLGTFMLDSGSDSNLVTSKLAEQITKTTYEGYSIKGVSGRVKEVLNGDKAILQFAKVRVRSDDIPVIDFSGTSSAFGSEIGGLIGIRTLVQMKMTIDYRDGLVNFQVYDFRKARE